jgi:hypothetical protein
VANLKRDKQDTLCPSLNTGELYVLDVMLEWAMDPKVARQQAAYIFLAEFQIRASFFEELQNAILAEALWAQTTVQLLSTYVTQTNKQVLKAR